MSTTRTNALAFMLIGLCLAAGCWSRQSSEPPKASVETTPAKPDAHSSIAVIDLDRVADGIGAVIKMRTALAQFEQKLVVELQKSTASLFGDKAPAGSDFAEFDRVAAPLVEVMAAEQQKEFGKYLRAAENQLLVRQKHLRIDFLNEVRPYAFQIARDQGCDLVLTTDQVYVATEQVDITSEVVRRICAINAAAETSQTSTTSGQPPAKLASGGSFPIR